MSQEQRLKIAIQKKGRLNNESCQLLERAGLVLNNYDDRLLYKCPNFPIDFVFLRDDDIPGYVESGVVDIGIVGKNIVEEKEADIDVVTALGFAKCRLSLAVHKKSEYTGLNFFHGKTIATTYPNILTKFLAENNIQAKMHKINGSVEVSIQMEFADAIFDIVSTGSTLRANNLVEVSRCYDSEALLIQNKELTEDQQSLVNDFLRRIQSVLFAKNKKYITFNIPVKNVEKATSLFPGLKSPTIMPLADKDWASFSAVMEEQEFWNITDQIKELEGEDILMFPIEKIIY